MKKQIHLMLLACMIVFQPATAAILPAVQPAAVVQTVSAVKPTKPVKTKVKKAEKQGKVNRFAKWGFILAAAGVVLLGFVPLVSFAFLPAGLILSAIGLSDVKKTGERGKGLGLAGILLSSLGILFIILALVLVLALLRGL
ncbi:MAG: DUF4190 domain-containing protein [Bacteroidetes bacterium]|nr:DUF4190 domain-containing protein [Bacteroidota bacterium]